MANYYTLSAFLIPCTQEQAEIALRALGRIEGGFDDFATQAIAKSESDELDPEEKIIRHCFYTHVEPDNIEITTEVEWGFVATLDSDGIVVHHDESIEVEQACYFAQAVLMAFDLPTMVEVQVSHTCSKPCIDGFGGTGIAVTKDDIRYCDTQIFIHRERAAADKNERYFLVKIAGADSGYQGQFVFKVAGEQSESERLQKILLANQESTGASDAASGLDSLGEVATDRVTQVLLTPSEYHTMSKHLPVH